MSSDTSKLGLFRLPPEIRNMIYNLYLQHYENYHARTPRLGNLFYSFQRRAERLELSLDVSYLYRSQCVGIPGDAFGWFLPPLAFTNTPLYVEVGTLILHRWRFKITGFFGMKYFSRFLEHFPRQMGFQFIQWLEIDEPYWYTVQPRSYGGIEVDPEIFRALLDQCTNVRCLTLSMATREMEGTIPDGMRHPALLHYSNIHHIHLNVSRSFNRNFTWIQPMKEYYDWLKNGYKQAGKDVAKIEVMYTNETPNSDTAKQFRPVLRRHNIAHYFGQARCSEG